MWRLYAYVHATYVNMQQQAAGLLQWRMRTPLIPVRIEFHQPCLGSVKVYSTNIDKKISVSTIVLSQLQHKIIICKNSELQSIPKTI